MRAAVVTAILFSFLAVPAFAQDAVPDYVQAAVADPGRPASDTRRDADRMPAQSVAFSRIKPGDRVVDFLPGEGYFTRIFSRIVGPRGHVYAVLPPDFVARYPRIRFILPHAGGTLPLVWGRLQRGQKVRPEANKAAKKPVRAYLRRFTYDTISHDASALRYLIDTVGADRVMLGTDFCFDMGYERPLDIIRDRAVKLSRADQALVVRDNAARLLRLR